MPSTAIAPPARGAAEPAAEQRAGGRADAADLGAGEAADLVLVQEVLGLVGEAAGRRPAPAERALQLAEDAVEAAAGAGPMFCAVFCSRPRVWVCPPRPCCMICPRMSPKLMGFPSQNELHQS